MVANETVDLQTVQWVVGLAAGAISGGVTSLLAFAVSLAVLRYKAANHESRLGLLEAEVKAQGSNLAEIGVKLDSIKSSVERVEGAMAKLTDRVGDAEKDAAVAVATTGSWPELKARPR